MDDAERTARAQIFGSMAETYAAYRPGYPDEAVQWLVPEPSSRVLEVGAGTGSLSESLLSGEHRLFASDPSYPMLKQLRRRLRSVPTAQATAEQLPFRAASVNVVVAAHAFHWFDHGLALPEAARVLRAGGTLSLAWNYRDETVPWVRKLSTIMGPEGHDVDPVELLEESGHFDGIETRTFRHWQQVDRDSLLGLVRTRSHIAALDESERSTLLERVGALYDDYGRGHDGMLLPYVTHCYRARVVGTKNTGDKPLGGLDDGLLIDFS